MRGEKRDGTHARMHADQKLCVVVRIHRRVSSPVRQQLNSSAPDVGHAWTCVCVCAITTQSTVPPPGRSCSTRCAATQAVPAGH